MRDEDKTKAQLSHELAQVKEALRESHTHFAGILEISNEAIISTDDAQRITLFNRGAEQIFAYSAAKAMGQPLDILLPKRFVALHRQHLTDFANSPESTRLMDERQKIIGRRASGEEFPAEASISKIEVAGREVFTVVLRDITKRQQAEQEREQLIEELDAFAHTVAHDFKEPLGLIIGYTHLLKEQARLPDELHVYLNAIARNGDRMNNISEELQLLAGVRKAEVELKPLNMGQIVAEALQRLAYLIEEYQARIVTPVSWPVALGYAPWVEEVWANYLGNAIKYGGQPPRVQVGVTARSDGMVRFWVRDNGSGIIPEAQDRLFRPFTRLEQVRARGHGLGLSIVRRIVEKLDGQVGLESEGVPGRGSVFSFTLPSQHHKRQVNSI